MNFARASLLDALLDRTVLASYSRVGYALRSRGWDASDLPPMDGRVVLVTGATSGLGAAAAEGFARLGASVWLVARKPERAEPIRDRITESTGRDDVHIGACDLSELTSVRRFARELRDAGGRIAVLVNNAGVLPGERSLSADGIELALATNVVGPFLLTALLDPMLRGGGRVVNVSSGGMYASRLRVDDLQSERGRFSGTAAYAHTKRMQVILSELWAQKLAPEGVVVNSMHPGWVDTAGLRHSLPHFHRVMRPLLRTPEQGADTIVWLGAAHEAAAASGGFWLDRAPRPTHLVPWTRESREDRERLWLETASLAGGSAQRQRMRGHAANRS